MENAALGFKLKSSYYEKSAKFISQNAPQWVAVWVESDDDKRLWSPLLNERYRRFKFKLHIASLLESKDEKYADGCNRIFSLIKNGNIELGKNSIACLDSDYSYISGNYECNEKELLESPYVFHTHVHSKENIYIHPMGVDKILGRALGEEINQHDIYLQEFTDTLSIALSDYIYQFITLYRVGDLEGFRYFSSKFIELVRVFFDNILIPNDLKIDCSFRIKKLFEKYDDEIKKYMLEKIDSNSYEEVKQRLQELSITNSDSLLFVRGHNIYPLIMGLYKKIDNHIFKIKRERYSAEHIPKETRSKKLSELANKRPNIEHLICSRNDTTSIPIFNRVLTQLDAFFQRV